jgi:predicted RNase H-like nuclease (RuvC/YqgF family)
MSDIVDRLLTENTMHSYYDSPSIQVEAAEEIKKLRAEVERLRADIENLCAENKRLRANPERPYHKPEELVGALQDRIHPTSGRLIDAHPLVTSARKAQEDGR